MSGMFHAPVMQELMEQFGKLPGIGPKTAQRLAFYVLSLPKNDVRAFADAMVKAKDTMTYCPICFSLTDVTPCQVCRDESRQRQVVCVVEELSLIHIFSRLQGYMDTAPPSPC